MQPAVRVDNVTKRYRLTAARGERGYRTLRDALSSAVASRFRRAARPEADDFWALKGVSFEIGRGEVVGIIGRNGAGKSTLLKILSRIVRPTGGRAELEGRVGSLLEVGTGFHPELSGAENVYLNGSILGMSRREIAKKFDEIVAFAEVERFLDLPVKRYSSGMYVRLAFAVAAHLEPEILIVDEVLAVGDAEFQKRCIAKMKRAGQTGATVLVVSHNLAVVENLCGRALLLDRGELVGEGDVRSQIRRYLSTEGSDDAWEFDLRRNDRRNTAAVAALTGLAVRCDGVPGTTLAMGGRLTLDIGYDLPGPVEDLKVGVVIEDSFGCKVAAFSPTFQAPDLLNPAPPRGTVRLDVPWVNFAEGEYWVNVHASADGHGDTVDHACRIRVTPADVFGTGKTLDGRIAATFLPSTWTAPGQEG
jgi:lipopolysaccharide transport system ATP-binding protein